MSTEASREHALGDRLKRERERLGLTQQQFADLVGVSRMTQGNYESGKRHPDARYLSEVSQAGVDLLYIATGKRQGDELYQVAAAECLLSCIAKALGLRGDSFSSIWEHATSLAACSIEAREGASSVNLSEVDSKCDQGVRELFALAPGVMNEPLMIASVQAIEEEIARQGVNVGPEKKARAALMVYKKSATVGSVDVDSAKDAVSLAS